MGQSEYASLMSRWKEKDKEMLRKAASKATAEAVQVKDLAEKASLPPGAISQFMSTGQLGDDRCDQLAQTLEDLGFWPIENGHSAAVEEAILDGLEIINTVMKMGKSLDARIVAVRPILEDLQKKIDAYRDSSAKTYQRTGEQNL